MKDIFTYPDNLATQFIDPNYVGDATVGFYKRVDDLRTGAYKAWTGTAPVESTNVLMKEFSKFHESLTESWGENTMYQFWQQPLIVATKEVISSDILNTVDTADVSSFINFTGNHGLADTQLMTLSGFDGSWAELNGNSYYVKKTDADTIQLCLDEALTQDVHFVIRDSIDYITHTNQSFTYPVMRIDVDITGMTAPLADGNGFDFAGFDGSLGDLINGRHLYIKAFDADTIELYEDAGLTTNVSLYNQAQASLTCVGTSSPVVINTTTTSAAPLVNGMPVKVTNTDGNLAHYADIPLYIQNLSGSTCNLSYDINGLQLLDMPYFYLPTDIETVSTFAGGGVEVTLGVETAGNGALYDGIRLAMHSIPTGLSTRNFSIVKWPQGASEALDWGIFQTDEIADYTYVRRENTGDMQLWSGPGGYEVLLDTLEDTLISHVAGGMNEDGTKVVAIDRADSNKVKLYTNTAGTFALDTTFPLDDRPFRAKISKNGNVVAYSENLNCNKVYVQKLISGQWVEQVITEPAGLGTSRVGNSIWGTDFAMSANGEVLVIANELGEFALYEYICAYTEYRLIQTFSDVTWGIGYANAVEWGQFTNICDVSYDGNTIAVGYPKYDTGSGNERGRCDVYVRPSDCSTQHVLVSNIQGGLDIAGFNYGQGIFLANNGIMLVLNNNAYGKADIWHRRADNEYDYNGYNEWGNVALRPCFVGLTAPEDAPLHFFTTYLTNDAIQHVYVREYWNIYSSVVGGFSTSVDGFTFDHVFLEYTGTDRVYKLYWDPTLTTPVDWTFSLPMYPVGSYSAPPFIKGKIYNPQTDSTFGTLTEIDNTSASVTALTNPVVSTTGTGYVDYVPAHAGIIPVTALTSATTGNLTIEANETHRYRLNNITAMTFGNTTYPQRTGASTYVNNAEITEGVWWNEGASAVSSGTYSQWPSVTVTTNASTTSTAEANTGYITAVSYNTEFPGYFNEPHDVRLLVQTVADTYIPAATPVVELQDVWDLETQWDTQGYAAYKHWPSYAETGVNPRSAKLIQITPSSSTRSQNGTKYVRSLGFTRWQLELEYPPLTEEQFRYLHAAAMNARGSFVPFNIINRDNKGNPLLLDFHNELATTTPRLVEDMVAGDKILTIEGFPSFLTQAVKKGEILGNYQLTSVNGQITMNLLDVDSNAYGEAKVKIPYSSEVGMATGEQLQFSPYSIVATLSEDNFEFDQDTLDYYYVKVKFDLDEWK